jgi:hypothetical protein
MTATRTPLWAHMCAVLAPVVVGCAFLSIGGASAPLSAVQAVYARTHVPVLFVLANLNSVRALVSVAAAAVYYATLAGW